MEQTPCSSVIEFQLIFLNINDFTPKHMMFLYHITVYILIVSHMYIYIYILTVIFCPFFLINWVKQLSNSFQINDIHHKKFKLLILNTWILSVFIRFWNHVYTPSILKLLWVGLCICGRSIIKRVIGHLSQKLWRWPCPNACPCFYRHPWSWSPRRKNKVILDLWNTNKEFKTIKNFTAIWWVFNGIIKTQTRCNLSSLRFNYHKYLIC